MSDVYVVDVADDDELAARFLEVNQELLEMWDSNGRAAFFTADWQTLEAEADALRPLIPSDIRRQLVDQVGEFFYQPQSGEFRETAVGVGR